MKAEDKEKLVKEVFNLEQAREIEKDGKKKGMLTKQINKLKKKVEDPGDDDEDDSHLYKISARSTTGREKYRRAGISLIEKFQNYEVSGEDLKRLEADPYVKIGDVTEPSEKKESKAPEDK